MNVGSGAEAAGGGAGWGGASPELWVENLTRKGSRLKASSGSGYWYMSMTDTESFLGAENSGRAEPATSCPARRIPAPHL